MKNLHLNIILLITIVFLIQSYASSQISQWRGPDRTGHYPDTNLLQEWPKKGPELIWKYEDLGIGYTTVAVTSDKIFTSGTFDSTSYLFAFNHSGELLWKKEYGLAWMTNYPGVRTTPLLYNNRGYLLSGRGKLICFDPENGEFIWTKNIYKDFDGREIKFGLTENLLIHDNKLFCTPGGEEYNVIALDPETGELIWKSKANGEKSGHCSPIIIDVGENKYFITITSNSIISLDPETGEMYWSHDLLYPQGIHGNSPIYQDGYLFAMNGWGFGSVMLKLLDEGKAVEEVWRSKLFDLEHGDVLLIGDNIYGTDWKTKHFWCVDWFTGEVKDSLKDFAASGIYADGLIYSYNYMGKINLIKPLKEGFEIISSFKVPDKGKDHIAYPVIHDGRLYLRHTNNLWVYDISE